MSDIISTLAIALLWIEWQWQGMNARFRFRQQAIRP
jgi:hypothetical protein